MSSFTTNPKARDYYVGWLCAVEIEYVVAQEILDEHYPTPSHQTDENSYYCGRIGAHNVVITCLPIGRYGTSSAASCATNMQRSFPNIKVNLMVGIAGGVPTAKNDIRLGDIVVSKPTGRTGGVIHYEYGKTIQNGRFEWTGHLNSPAPALLTATQTLASMHHNNGHRINETVDSILAKKPHLLRDYCKPDADVLYHSDYLHPQGVSGTCRQLCGDRYLVHRKPRPQTQNQPTIHYGLIASADRLVKDANVRDQLAQEEDVLCFEMEAAGLMNTIQCLVIRGICDYSDTHKNDTWQGYAAAVAAAYAKELLQIIDAPEVLSAPEASQMQHHIAPTPPSPYAAIPAAVAGGEVDKTCKYCREWSSWALGIGCPKHCSECTAKNDPGFCRKLRSGFERYGYWNKDELCPPHIRQREIREDELLVKAMRQAAIEAHEQDSSGPPMSFNFSLGSDTSKQQRQNVGFYNTSNGNLSVPNATRYGYNTSRVAPSGQYNSSATFSRSLNASRNGSNVSIGGRSFGPTGPNRKRN